MVLLIPSTSWSAVGKTAEEKAGNWSLVCLEGMLGTAASDEVVKVEQQIAAASPVVLNTFYLLTGCCQENQSPVLSVSSAVHWPRVRAGLCVLV